MAGVPPGARAPGRIRGRIRGASRSAVVHGPGMKLPLLCFAPGPASALALVPAMALLACAQGASAASDTPARPASPPAPHAPVAPPQAPAADACKPSGSVVFEVDHRAVPGAKLATSTIKLHGNGAWVRVETNSDGQALAPTSDCLGRAELKQLVDGLHAAPWKVTTARVHCMAVSSTFTEYQVDGKLVFTQKLCSGQTLDDKSRAALDYAAAQVDPAAARPTP